MDKFNFKDLGKSLILEAISDKKRKIEALFCQVHQRHPSVIIKGTDLDIKCCCDALMERTKAV